MLSDSEADCDAFDSASERASKKLLSPNFRFFRIYATYMLFVLLLFVFFMPIRVGFFPRGRWPATRFVRSVLQRQASLRYSVCVLLYPDIY